MYQRILLKLSGEALGSKDSVFDVDVMSKLALQVKEILAMGTEVAVVVGGGNLVRGKAFEKIGLDRVASDHIGMLGTTPWCLPRRWRKTAFRLTSCPLPSWTGWKGSMSRRPEISYPKSTS